MVRPPMEFIDHALSWVRCRVGHTPSCSLGLKSPLVSFKLPMAALILLYTRHSLQEPNISFCPANILPGSDHFHPSHKKDSPEAAARKGAAYTSASVTSSSRLHSCPTSQTASPTLQSHPCPACASCLLLELSVSVFLQQGLCQFQVPVPRCPCWACRSWLHTSSWLRAQPGKTGAAGGGGIPGGYEPWGMEGARRQNRRSGHCAEHWVEGLGRRSAWGLLVGALKAKERHIDDTSG